MRWVAFSSLFAGITGYLVIFLATSTLGAERFEVFNVYWGLFFTLQGIIQGLMHETTRGVRSALAAEERRAETADAGDGASDDAEPDDPTADELLTDAPDTRQLAAAPEERARPLRIGTTFGLVAGGLVLATSPLWSGTMLGQDHLVLGVVLLAVATALVAVQAVFSGILSGSARWRTFGILLTLDATARIAVAAIAVFLGEPVAGFMFATVAGVVVTPIMILVARSNRAVLGLRADVRPREFVRRSLHAMLAASAAAVLVVGFPVIIKATLHDVDPVVISNLLLAVTLTRAPVLMPISSFQNAIVVYFVDRVHRGRVVVWAPLGIVMGVAAIGAVLAWLVGPPIIELMGSGFSVGGPVLAALTFAAGFTGCLFITGSAVLARERHALYVAGWWTASAIAVIILLVVPQPVEATVLALSVGPAVGALVHIVFGMRGDAPLQRCAGTGAAQHPEAIESADDRVAPGPAARPADGGGAASR